MYIYQGLGLKYAAILGLLALGLVVATIGICAKPRRDAARWLYLFLSIIPLAIGAYATLEGSIVVRFFSETPEQIVEGRSLAMVSLWVGLAITTPFFILALVMLNRKRNAHSTQGTDDHATQVVQPGDFPATSAPGSMFLAGLALLLPFTVVPVQLFALPPTITVQRIAAWCMIGLSSVLVILDQRRLRQAASEDGKLPWFVELGGLVGLWGLLFPMMFLFRRRFGGPNLFPLALGGVLLFLLLPMAMLAFGSLPPGSLSPASPGTPFAPGHKFEVRLASEQPLEGFEKALASNGADYLYVSSEVLADNSGVSVIRQGVDAVGNSSLIFQFNDSASRRLLKITRSNRGGLLAMLTNGTVELAVPIGEPFGASASMSFTDSERCRRMVERLTGRSFMDQTVESN